LSVSCTVTPASDDDEDDDPPAAGLLDESFEHAANAIDRTAPVARNVVRRISGSPSGSREVS
jgi:hypothetical protein